ncbi:hypothetical protein C4D60_Mb06t13240 [Musa balbisiana]|uniref:Uncharacterized protein n=1 Tax=Musa balbisiana TaxID=52838 RepID=A0A4S8IMQ0_MUSBA|nr:hypothetical protein C4D60_Mb06t13240 [Musa balbisiana]
MMSLKSSLDFGIEKFSLSNRSKTENLKTVQDNGSIQVELPISRSSDSHSCGPTKLAGSSSKSWRKISVELQQLVSSIKRTRGTIVMKVFIWIGVT